MAAIGRKLHLNCSNLFMLEMTKCCPNLPQQIHTSTALSTRVFTKSYDALWTCFVVLAGQVAICFILSQWQTSRMFFILCPTASFHFGFILQTLDVTSNMLEGHKKNNLCCLYWERPLLRRSSLLCSLLSLSCSTALKWSWEFFFFPNYTKLWSEFKDSFMNSKADNAK